MGLNAGRRVAIAGGGIAGLTAAVAFARTGAAVTLVERAPALAEVGAGLQLGPNGTACLAALGVPLPGAPLEAVDLVAGRSGHRLARLPVGEMGYATPWHAAHRADVITNLAKAATDAGVVLRTGTVVKGVSDEGLETEGDLIEADIVIAADGLRSTLASQIIAAPDPTFTGQVAWRALVPLPSDWSDRAQVHLLPGRHVVAYPLRDRGVLNLVAVEERDEWTAEGWSHPGDAAQAISRFEDLAQNMRNVLQSIETVHVWGLFKRDVPAIWHSGMAGIIGDAVHPTLPFLAQGANLGLEDALCLAHAMDRAEDVTEGWQAFTRMRLDRVRRVVGAADRNATLYHLSGPAAMAAHLGLRAGSALAPKAPLRSFDWLYRWTPPAL